MSIRTQRYIYIYMELILLCLYIGEHTMKDNTCLPLSQFYDYWLIWFQHCALAGLQ